MRRRERVGNHVILTAAQARQAYNELGRLTEQEMHMLSEHTHVWKIRYLTNIYGAAAHVARAEYERWEQQKIAG